MSREEEKKLKTWQWPDQWLYDHFNKKLRLQIKNFGEEKMKEKVAELRGLQRSLVAKCVESPSKASTNFEETSEEERPFVPWSRDVIGYKMK